MFSLQSALGCAQWNARMLIKNVRFYTGLLLGFLICFFLTEKTITLSSTFDTSLNVFEPFIWSFADGDSILFASLALILPLSEVPRLDASASYLIFRSGRLNWLIGQMITVVALSLFYTSFLLLSTAILTAGNAFLANHWSDTATVMSFAPDQFDVALTVVRKTVKLTTPYHCMVQIFLLMLQYVLLLSCLSLAVSLRRGKRAGMSSIVILSFAAYLLTPDRFMVWLDLSDDLAYIANLLAAWLSPLQHAAYTMHSFGYDALPTLFQSHLLFGGINIGLLALCFAALSNMQFQFQKGEHYGSRG